MHVYFERTCYCIRIGVFDCNWNWILPINADSWIYHQWSRWVRHKWACWTKVKRKCICSPRLNSNTWQSIDKHGSCFQGFIYQAGSEVRLRWSWNSKSEYKRWIWCCCRVTESCRNHYLICSCCWSVSCHYAKYLGRERYKWR